MNLLPLVMRATVALLPTSSADEGGHWAFQPLRAESGSSIDRLVTRDLSTHRLSTAPRAAPDRLLRRVHLLLTGLPPSPAELSTFRADSSPERYAAVVDDLLARPGFGERWARHWLDLARYADTSGLHQDTHRPHAWRYRDYVIASFNQDKPYGRFIREQIAGDLLAPRDANSWIATGFCRTGPSNEANIGAAELKAYRLDQLDGILSTVSSVFLGQTIGCARCHDHKTDPFTAGDYYSLLSVFNNTADAFVSLKGDAPGAPKLFSPKARKAPKIPTGSGIRALGTLPESQRKVTRILERGDVNSPGEAVVAGVPVVLRGIPAKFSRTEPSARLALADWIASTENPLTWRVMANRVWQHLFGRGLVGTPSNLGVSGSPPTHPALLDHLAIVLRDSDGRIKPLIREICLSHAFQQDSAYRKSAHASDPANHLYWRFPKHRLEAEVIRDSILSSSGKLNRKMGGSGIKPRIPSEIITQSMRNQWPRVKTETATHWRRSVYIYLKRQLPMPLMELLDAPDSSESCALRFESTTPTQALALLNDAFVNEQAGHAVERARREKPDAPAQRLMELTWARAPSAAELAKARAFLEKPEITLVDLGVVLFNSSPFVYVD